MILNLCDVASEGNGNKATFEQANVIMYRPRPLWGKVNCIDRVYLPVRNEGRGKFKGLHGRLKRLFFSCIKMRASRSMPMSNKLWHYNIAYFYNIIIIIDVLLFYITSYGTILNITKVDFNCIVLINKSKGDYLGTITIE